MATLDDKPPSAEALAEKKSHDDNSSIAVVDYDRGVDVAVNLVVGHADDADLTPEEASRIRRKLDWHIMPLLLALYLVQFLDKQGIQQSAILGIITQNHLTQNQYNNIASAFYIGYLAASWPQNLALQKFPVGKWMSFNVLSWALIVGLHSQCHTYGKLFGIRFLLGCAESSVNAAVMLMTSMFYTPTEIGERIGWCFAIAGLGTSLNAFISYGALQVSPKAYPNQWEWEMIIIAIVTALIGFLLLAFLPDNPTNARFLSPEEKLMAVKRIKRNGNGIETKTWKKYQMIEAFLDIRVYLFGLWVAFCNLSAGVGIQLSIIIKDFGFTTLQTTLLNIPSGFASFLGVILAGLALRRFPNSRGMIIILWMIPEILSCILLITLKNKNALLFCFYLFNLGGLGAFVLILAWVTSTFSGHTKRTTANAIIFVFYGTAASLNTQYWKKKYRPHDIVPFSIIIANFTLTMIIAALLWYLLDRENKRRDHLKAEAETSGNHIHEFDEFGYIDIHGPDGKVTRQKVEKNYMDLTDKENLSFRYVL